jgi:hypothetical protein
MNKLVKDEDNKESDSKAGDSKEGNSKEGDGLNLKQALFFIVYLFRNFYVDYK